MNDWQYDEDDPEPEEEESDWSTSRATASNSVIAQQHNLNLSRSVGYMQPGRR